MTRPSPLTVVAAALVATGCATTTQFQRSLADRQWGAAAREFDADSSLRHDEPSMYSAAMLFGTPGRPTYDPAKGRALLREYLQRFPDSPRRSEASARLALLDEVVRARTSEAARLRDLEARLDAAHAEIRLLTLRLDSAVAQGETARRTTERLEADLKDREEQVRALRLELQRLKEIDLKPRRPPGTAESPT